MNYTNNIFGNIHYTPEDGTYTDPTPIVINGRPSDCNLHIFEDQYFAQAKLSSALEQLNQLEVLDQLAREAFLQRYQQADDVVADFVHDHFEYSDETTQEIAQTLGTTDRNYMLFLDKIELGSVSLANSASLEDKGAGTYEITLDYSLIWVGGISFTDQILVARFDQDNQLLQVAHES